MPKWQTNPIGTQIDINIANRKQQKIDTIMTVKPLSDRVLVLPNPAETTTASGLIIPDSAKEKPAAGKVIAVGPGTAEIKMEVKVGDEVLYGKYAGTELNIDGESYLMMAQRDILAVVEK